MRSLFLHDRARGRLAIGGPFRLLGLDLLRHGVDDGSRPLEGVLGKHVEHLRPNLFFELDVEFHGYMIL